MDALVCRWEESSDCNKYKATPSGDWNTIAMVHSIVEHAPSEDCFLYAPLKSIHSSGEHIYAEMLAADWSWKTYGSFLVLSESLFLIRFSLCMGELQCQREHVREIMGEWSCQRDYVRESISESAYQRDFIRECVSKRLCQRDYIREIVSETLYQRHFVWENMSESLSESLLECLSETVSGVLSERKCQGACQR